MSHSNPDVTIQDILEDLESVLEQFRLNAAELDALLPSILDKAFKGEL